MAFIKWLEPYEPQKNTEVLPGSLESPRDGLHKKKTIWREQTMKNHGKPLDLRALYFETKPNSHLQILQLCFFNFCRWIHSTWFCSQFPVTERHFSGGLSLKSHSNALVDIRAPCMTFVLPKRVHGLFDIKWCPSHCPSHSAPAFFTDSSTYKDYNVFVFFRIFAGKWMKTKPRKPQDFMVQKPWRIIPRIISG